MTVLVTGATGFVGQHLVRRLAGTDDIAVFARDPDVATQMFGDSVSVPSATSATRRRSTARAGGRAYTLGARTRSRGVAVSGFTSRTLGTRNLMEAAPARDAPNRLLQSRRCTGSDFGTSLREAILTGTNEYSTRARCAERAGAEFKDLPVITVDPAGHGPHDAWGRAPRLIKLAAAGFAFAGSGSNASALHTMTSPTDPRRCRSGSTAKRSAARSAAHTFFAATFRRCALRGWRPSTDHLPLRGALAASSAGARWLLAPSDR